MAAPTFEIYQDKKGDWRWRLLATNKEPLAVSEEGFSSKQSVKNSIESVRKATITAEIIETD